MPPLSCQSGMPHWLPVPTVLLSCGSGFRQRLFVVVCFAEPLQVVECMVVAGCDVVAFSTGFGASLPLLVPLALPFGSCFDLFA